MFKQEICGHFFKHIGMGDVWIFFFCSLPRLVQCPHLPSPIRLTSMSREGKIQGIGNRWFYHRGANKREEKEGIERKIFPTQGSEIHRKGSSAFVSVGYMLAHVRGLDKRWKEFRYNEKGTSGTKYNWGEVQIFSSFCCCWFQLENKIHGTILLVSYPEESYTHRFERVRSTQYVCICGEWENPNTCHILSVWCSLVGCFDFFTFSSALTHWLVGWHCSGIVDIDDEAMSCRKGAYRIAAYRC